MGTLAKDSIRVSIIVSVGFMLGTVINIFIYPRIASKTDLGIYRYLLNWGTLFAQFLSLGMGSAAVRTYYAAKSYAKLGELNALLLFMPLIAYAIFAMLFVFIASWFLLETSNLHQVPEQIMVISMLLFTLALTFVKTYGSVAIVLRKSAGVFFNSEIYIRLAVFVMFLLYWGKVVDRAELVIGLGICHISQMILLILLVRDFLTEHTLKVPKKQTFNSFLFLSMFCLLDNSASMIIFQIDVIMIGVLCFDSFASIQEYSMAMALVAIVYMPWRPIYSTTIPYIAEAFKDSDYKKIETIYQKSSLNLLMAGAALFVLIFTSIDDIIAIIPDDYSGIKYPFLFLAIGKIIDMIAAVNGNIIALSPFYKYNLYFNLLLSVIVLGLNFILIPYMGISGAALSTTVGILLVNFLRCLLVYKKYGIHPLHQNTATVLLSMGAVFCIGWIIPDVFTHAMLNIFFRGGVLILLMYTFIALSKPSEDIEKLRLKVLGMVGFNRKGK